MNEDPERDPETAEPGGDGPSDETVAADRTVIAPRRANDETVFAPRHTVDETVVVMRNDPGGEGAEPDPVPVPVPESDRVERPLAASRSGRRAADRRGLDPARPIPPVPGASPWEALPAGERGVARGLPVSYGARPRTTAGTVHGPDEVQRRIGPAPQAQGEPRAVRGDRDDLPSLARRDRRRRRTTLVLYAATALLSLLGLWGVAALTFGW